MTNADKIRNMTDDEMLKDGCKYIIGTISL